MLASMFLILPSGLNAKKSKDTEKKPVVLTKERIAEIDQICAALQQRINDKAGPYQYEASARWGEKWGLMVRALTTSKEFDNLHLKQSDFMAYDKATNKWMYKPMYVHYPDLEQSGTDSYIPKTDEIDKLATLLTNPEKYDKIRAAFADFAKSKTRKEQLLEFRKLVKTTLNDRILDTLQSVEKSLELRLVVQSFVVFDAMARSSKTPSKLSKQQMRNLVYSASRDVMAHPEFVSRTCVNLFMFLSNSRVPCDPETADEEKMKLISKGTEKACLTAYHVLFAAKVKNSYIQQEVRKYESTKEAEKIQQREEIMRQKIQEENKKKLEKYFMEHPEKAAQMDKVQTNSD